MSFNRGDKVLINNNLVATIENYSPETNLVVFVSEPAGGGTNTHTEHISLTTIDLIEPAAPVESVVEDEKESETEDEK